MYHCYKRAHDFHDWLDLEAVSDVTLEEFHESLVKEKKKVI